jgi:glycosyltransferase involved in cell wall biosynthesis
MRIVFNPIHCTPFHGDTLITTPIGGTETAVIHLAQALHDLGHDVIVMTPLKNPPKTHPRYLPADCVQDIDFIDVYILVRGWLEIFRPIKAKKKFVWTGDSYSNQNTLGIGDNRFAKSVDGLLCVSEWQRETLCQASGFPLEKTALLRDGVNLKDFAGQEIRNPHRLIYASNPQRGLMYFIYIFLKLKLKYPDLELHIFSNSAMFDMEWPPKVAMDAPHEAVLSLFRPIPGCFVHGTVVQSQLAREYMKSAIWAYPSKVEETACISALEAQAAGCACITSAMGALEESIGNAGIFIRETPGSDLFLEKFTEGLDHLLSDESERHLLSENGLKRSLNFDWKVIAQEFLEYLKNQHGLT